MASAVLTLQSRLCGTPPGAPPLPRGFGCWSLGHGMHPGDWFQLDLGSTQTFDQLVLDTTASSGDFVRQCEVYTSDYGTTWDMPVVTGPGSTVTRIQLPTTTARYIRVVNEAGSGSWWFIHDVSGYAPGGWITTATSSNTGPQRQNTTLPDGARLQVAYNSGTGMAVFDIP